VKRLTDPLVSIVVPAYNVEKYIKKCVDSLLNQTYENIEIIIVNDGSTDNTSKIIRNNFFDEQKVIILEKSNGGLSSARNYGIKKSNGNFLSFVDSDDWVAPSFIEDMISFMMQTNSDISICNMKYCFSDGTERKRTPKIEKREVVSSRKAFDLLLSGDFYKAHAQNKIYKKSLFLDNNIQFPHNKLYEDVFTTYKLLLNANKVCLLDKNLYFYLQEREGSILNKRFSVSRFDIISALEQILVMVKKDENNLFQKFYVTNIISLVNYIYPIYDSLSDNQINDYKNRLLENTTLSKFNDGLFYNKELNCIEKIRFFLIKKNLGIYCHIFKKIKFVRGKL